ncbi:hypothetical protein LB543_05065 [Mesorhizobium sp. ESP7-2]|uniref:hypothetical protein n=1 Tax=Mesorhizobium sp. ESP7-2 TaxID=2876622 RepID=UPI001CCAE754|nr:hypothetical protein [Mesorhizobium sp. ESP7-2]MBZ9706089.1 hypothetical protein [Mesorhizobium sp. ESP7-2]
MTTAQTLPVIFRKFRGELCAYFPTETWDDRGTITCYAPVGQHGGANRSWLQRGRLAKPDEYASLLIELRGIYESHDADHIDLKVYKRAPRAKAVR